MNILLGGLETSFVDWFLIFDERAGGYTGETSTDMLNYCFRNRRRSSHVMITHLIFEIKIRDVGSTPVCCFEERVVEI
jgi:hypothetical protein